MTNVLFSFPQMDHLANITEKQPMTDPGFINLKIDFFLLFSNESFLSCIIS